MQILRGLLLVVFFFQSCCFDCSVSFETIGQEISKYHFNIVGILGEESDKAYVEVWYSEATADGKNKVVHKWVKPPIIIGGHYSNVTYDLTKSSHGRKIVEKAVIDYSEGGSHYMKIVNHGSDPIEYFIAGTHKLRTYSYSSKNDLIDITPRILYNGIPIYYMLFPEKAPKSDLYTCVTPICDRVERISFQVDKQYTVENIMKLYRAEYNNSIDTILTYKYFRAWTKDDTREIREFGGHPTGDIRYTNAKFYASILPNDSSESSDTTPFISHVCGDNHCDAIKKTRGY